MSAAPQTLSENAIAALVDAAREGRLPEEPAAAPQRRKRPKVVDFTRPTKFTPEEQRRLERSLEAFCRTASTRLSAELRAPLELEVISTTQLTWANAHAQMPPASITALVEAKPAGTSLMLSCEQALVVGAIELLLGANGVSDQRERRFTDIDWALARHFFERLMAQLSIIWSDLAGLELSVGRLETHMETAQMVPVSEPTLTLTMEARLDGVSSTLAMLLPWSAIAPVAGSFSARDDALAVRDGDHADSARRAVGRVRTTVRAEVAAIELPIEQVLALQPGSVLRLGAPADAGVTLYADRVPLQRAKPGRSGSRRAVQVTGPLEGAS
jgi:flagellar motor switch protein FliM